VDPELKSSLKTMAWGTVAFMLIFIAIGFALRDELTLVGKTIAGGLGYPGIGLGIMLSDMFTLPIPPDAYLAIAATAGMDTGLVIFWGSLGSILGGIGAYWLGRLLGKTPFAKRLMEPFRERGEKFIDRAGVMAVVIAALTPIPFSIVCMLAGMGGMHFMTHFLPATVFRIPRIAGYFLLIKWGWVVAGGG